MQSPQSESTPRRLTLTLLDLPSEFVEIDEDSESFLGLFLMVLGSLQFRSGGNLSRIFFGLRHHNCSGRMQFQSTQGNQRATPISMVRNTMSCVLRLVKFTLKKKMYFASKKMRKNCSKVHF